MNKSWYSLVPFGVLRRTPSYDGVDAPNLNRKKGEENAKLESKWPDRFTTGG